MVRKHVFKLGFMWADSLPQLRIALVNATYA